MKNLKKHLIFFIITILDLSSISFASENDLSLKSIINPLPIEMIDGSNIVK